LINVEIDHTEKNRRPLDVLLPMIYTDISLDNCVPY